MHTHISLHNTKSTTVTPVVGLHITPDWKYTRRIIVLDTEGQAVTIDLYADSENAILLRQEGENDVL